MKITLKKVAKEESVASKLIDEMGNTYGSLTVIGLDEFRIQPNAKTARWICMCECGVSCTVRGSDLRNGNQQRCGECAKIARKKPRAGLYVVKAGPFYKVGTADKVEQRLKNLQDSCPFEIELIYWNPSRGDEEREIHKILKQYNTRGEWFSVNPHSTEILTGVCGI